MVATGGGVILDPQSRTVLRENFFTVWLKAAPETIYARLSSDPGSSQTRPSLCELPIRDEIEKVLSEREPLYSQVADMQIDTEGRQTMRIADQIASILSQSSS